MRYEIRTTFTPWRAVPKEDYDAYVTFLERRWRTEVSGTISKEDFMASYAHEVRDSEGE